MSQTPHDIKNYCKVHNLFVGNYVMIEENGKWCCGRITDMSRKEYVHISDVWWRNSYGLTASELSEYLLSNRLYKITEKDFHEYVRNRQEEQARLATLPQTK